MTNWPPPKEELYEMIEKEGYIIAMSRFIERPKNKGFKDIKPGGKIEFYFDPLKENK